MTFAIKLQAGFFKTILYYLTVEPGLIIMLSQENQEDNESGRLVIQDEDLLSVSITRRNMTCGELEIITRDKIYIGKLSNQPDLEKAVQVFTDEFGDKFNYQE
ncbi:MAG: hypothetical protein VB084_03935 [Syntrophomonadaceae bacterium]|nr:hypothetical protein [Syntrophomonadaceae bacterium]